MKIKKIISFMLAVLVLGTAEILPASADSENFDNGICGFNLSYSFDEPTGTLTISGTGKMEDFADEPDDGDVGPYCDIPWQDYQSKITSVIIENGVASIGDYAFENCKNLTYVSIPKTVESIGRYAFQYCKSLNELEIPDSVVYVGIDAFDWTAWFNSQLPGPVYVGSVLYGCKGTCPKNVKIAEGIKSIAIGAFSHCKSIETVTFPDSVTTMGEDVFEDCTNLKEVRLSENLDNIPYQAFYKCINLKSVTVPDNVAELSWWAFAGCENLTDVDLGNGVKTLNGGVFSECKSLKEINIPASVEKIDYSPYASLFSQCDSLEKITVDKNNKTYDSRDNCNAVIETKTNMLTVGCKTSVIPDTVTAVGENAFNNCTSLTELYLPDSVKVIGERAFIYCKNLKKIKFPKKMNSIDDYAFAYCKSLKKFVLPKGIASVSWGMLEGCKSLEKISIPDSVTAIYAYAFEECKKITEVKIPKKVDCFTPEAFYKCTGIKKITVDKNNKTYDSRENCNAVIETKTNTLLLGCRNTVIPSSVKCLDGDAFDNCKRLKKLVIPYGVETIKNYSFAYCSDLKTLIIPKSVKHLGSILWECNSSISIYYAGSKKEWEKMNTDDSEYDCKFENNTRLKDIVHFNYQYTKIKLPKSSIVLHAKQKYRIKPKIKNPIGKTVYKTGNKKIAAVSSKGVVTARKKGRTKITVYNNGVKKTLTVKVL